MKKNSLITSVFLSCIALAFMLVSCTKEDVPENPYDEVDYSTPGQTFPEPDPNSITGLYKNIFFPKCANPGCHDGTFEPDFRTIESSYATLVYQPVNKLTLDSVKIYSHRVIPNNVDDSWLIERLTTSTTEYMPSNATRLSATEINHVKNWINGGCKDMNGTIAVKPNLPPNIIGYVAVDSMNFNTRLDTNRLNNFPVNPFVVDQGTKMLIAIVATDTADGDSATDPANFTVKKIKLSLDKNDFSAATTVSAYFYFSGIWLVYVPVNSWASGTTVYFRIYVNDGHHTTDSEFPRNGSMDYYKTLYAFYVQ